MHGSGLKLFCSFVDLEPIFLNRICNLILLIVLLFFALMSVFLFKSLYDAPFLKVTTR